MIPFRSDSVPIPVFFLQISFNSLKLQSSLPSNQLKYLHKTCSPKTLVNLLFNDLKVKSLHKLTLRLWSRSQRLKIEMYRKIEFDRLSNQKSVNQTIAFLLCNIITHLRPHCYPESLLLSLYLRPSAWTLIEWRLCAGGAYSNVNCNCCGFDCCSLKGSWRFFYQLINHQTVTKWWESLKWRQQTATTKMTHVEVSQNLFFWFLLFPRNLQRPAQMWATSRAIFSSCHSQPSFIDRKSAYRKGIKIRYSATLSRANLTPSN